MLNNLHRNLFGIASIIFVVACVALFVFPPWALEGKLSPFLGHAYVGAVFNESDVAEVSGMPARIMIDLLLAEWALAAIVCFGTATSLSLTSGSDQTTQGSKTNHRW